MRLAHLADLHLGWRQFDRTDASGANQREVDVEHAFIAAVDGILAAKPDAVLIAGDVFHSVRPTNRAILCAFAQIARLRTVVPEVVIIAGNHDTPRSAETGLILPLLEQAGARVCARACARFELAGATITCVPSSVVDAAGAAAEIPGPLKDRVNVLLMHGDLVGYPSGALKFSGTGRLDPDAVVAGWDYVALGDYHSCAEIRPRMWYAGSIEYTSSNVWADLAAGAKCWLLVDVEAGRAPIVEQRTIPTRRHIDLPPFLAANLTAQQVDARLLERITEFPIADAIARLIVVDCPREVQRALNHTQIRQWKASALNLKLELRKPDHETSTQASRARVFKKIDDTVRDFLGQRELPAGLDRQAFVELGMGYVDQTKDGSEPAP